MSDGSERLNAMNARASGDLDGPRSQRGVPIGRPEDRDVYWVFLAPALFLLIAGWCALIQLPGHTKPAQVLSCGAHTLTRRGPTSSSLSEGCAGARRSTCGGSSLT